MRFQRHGGRKLAAIYLGGITGALVRVGLAEAFSHEAGSWPWPTFAVNLLGAFLIGYFFASFRDHEPEQLHHPFFATGLCGTLTTFSTLQLELYSMVQGGHLGLAATYCGATLSLGYLAVQLGTAVERRSLTEERA
jgi:CrcB protein